MGVNLSNPSPGITGAMSAPESVYNAYVKGQQDAINLSTMQQALAKETQQNQITSLMAPITTASAMDKMMGGVQVLDTGAVSRGIETAREAAVGNFASSGVDNLILDGSAQAEAALKAAIATTIAALKRKGVKTDEIEKQFEAMSKPMPITPMHTPDEPQRRMPQGLFMMMNSGGPGGVQAEAPPEAAAPPAEPQELPATQVTAAPVEGIPELTKTGNYDLSTIPGVLQWRKDQMERFGPVTDVTAQALRGQDAITMQTLLRAAQAADGRNLNRAQIIDRQKATHQQHLNNLLQQLRGMVPPDHAPRVGRSGGQPKEDPQIKSLRETIERSVKDLEEKDFKSWGPKDKKVESQARSILQQANIPQLAILRAQLEAKFIGMGINIHGKSGGGGGGFDREKAKAKIREALKSQQGGKK